MLRGIALTAGGLLIAAAALAAVTDIPTRYSGSFPSITRPRRAYKITGTFTGSTLNLKYTAIRGAVISPSSARFTCTTASSNKSSCTGTFRSDDGQFSGNSALTITWGKGRPVALSVGNC